MVSAVVKQRDMYRTLLAQSTPLPVESDQTMGSKVTTVTTPTKGVETGDMETTPTSQMDSEATQALKVHVHVHVHVQYRSRGTYTRASSASDCTREFESVKLDKRRSSTRALERSHSSTGALALELHSKPAPLALERSHTYRSTARHVALVYTALLSWQVAARHVALGYTLNTKLASCCSTRGARILSR